MCNMQEFITKMPHDLGCWKSRIESGTVEAVEHLVVKTDVFEY